ncbi:MAG: prenyltransferase [Acidimicrobiales bacterium]
MWLADLPGVISADQLAATVSSIEDTQLRGGLIPWFEGGHADVWNHTEAAMALLLGGRRTEAEAAWRWLAANQRPDGAWHRYYVVDDAGRQHVEEDKLDANCCAYVATGLWHAYRCTGDRALAAAYWPMVRRALDFVVGLQTDRGEILWARHADGTPWSFALLTGSCSISLSLRCGLALAEVLGDRQPAWEAALARLLRVIRHDPGAFAPKHRWAMDWYYPVLVGALDPEAADARLEQGRDRFLMDGQGVRCVVDEPWVTAAETCEAALAHLAAGRSQQALALFSWVQAHRHGPSGRYFTGLVHPGAVTFPDQETSTYSAAAVVLCADALSAASPAADLFTNPPPAAAAEPRPTRLTAQERATG